MRNTARALVALLLLIAVPALGQQFPTTFPQDTVYGRLGIGSGPGQAIPFATLRSRLLAVSAQGAFTFLGNNTAATGPTTAVDIAALTSKISPAAGDYLLLSDQAASGAWKKVPISSVGVVPGARTRLTTNTSFYVRTNGSDSNDCLANTAGGACLTLQGAYNKIYNAYDCAGFIATVNVAAGTYGAGLALFGPPCVGTPANTLNGIQFVGDATTPANVVINGGSPANILATYGGSAVVSGFKFTCSNDCLYASGGGKISIPGKVEFGVAGGFHIHANVNGVIVTSASAYLISGGAQGHIFASKNSTIEIGTTAVTISNTPAFSLATFVSIFGYIALVQPVTFGGTGATGQRYIASTNGILDSQAAGSASTYFPGNSDGLASTGGIQN